MLIVKILLQVGTMLGAVLIAVLDYSWRDKRTSKFKKVRCALYIILLILFPASIFVTINDDLEKKQEIKERNIKIEDIKDELTGGDSYCYFIHRTHMYTSNSEPPSYNDIELWLMHSGKYPLGTISIRLVDLQKAHQLLKEQLKSPLPYEKLTAAMDREYRIPSLDREHSVILTLSAVGVDSAQTPDRMSRSIWHSAAPTSGCCCSHPTMPLSA